MRNVCPLCNSKVSVEGSTWKCTGNKLRYWGKQFKLYEEANNENKTKILVKYKDTEIFMEMYEKWSIIDSRGKRSNWECNYSTHVYTPVPENIVIILDPIQGKQLERKLGRPLTEDELMSDNIVIDGVKIELHKVTYPDDLI